MLKLHHAPNSRAGRIVWLLEELKLPYDINTMKFHPSDLKSDEHELDILLEEGHHLKIMILVFMNQEL